MKITWHILSVWILLTSFLVGEDVKLPITLTKLQKNLNLRLESLAGGHYVWDVSRHLSTKGFEETSAEYTLDYINPKEYILKIVFNPKNNPFTFILKAHAGMLYAINDSLKHVDASDDIKQSMNVLMGIPEIFLGKVLPLNEMPIPTSISTLNDQITYIWAKKGYSNELTFNSSSLSIIKFKMSQNGNVLMSWEGSTAPSGSLLPTNAVYTIVGANNVIDTKESWKLIEERHDVPPDTVDTSYKIPTNYSVTLFAKGQAYPLNSGG